MGIVEVASRISSGIGQRGQAVVSRAWRVSTRIALLFVLLCLSPVLVPCLLLVAIPIGFLLLVFVHLPRVWNRLRPSPFRRGLAFHREKFGAPLPPSTAFNVPYAVGRRTEEVATPPASPSYANSDFGYPQPAVDAGDLKGALRQAQDPISTSEEDEDVTQSQRFRLGRETAQEGLMASGSPCSPPWSPSRGQDESAALARRIRREIVGLKKFVGDDSPSRGPLLSEIEELGTFLGIDLPISTARDGDLQRANECVQLLKLVVGVQFR